MQMADVYQICSAGGFIMAYVFLASIILGFFTAEILELVKKKYPRKEPVRIEPDFTSFGAKVVKLKQTAEE